ncbi:hypothetical protein HJG60_012063 [Phyllostomus discolor]|uniref:Uncharacterized protein n=1 Tax=Phyllostomus discolor TaxID=89673 RepID=A0A834DWC2_9CHIR|nr:hypothetical protein HJG60_012063 [Phyllostomus discolor]
MGPGKGWPSNQPEQPNLPPTPAPAPQPRCPPTLAASWLSTFQHGHLSLWPPRSCHLGYAIPVEVGDRGPLLQGFTRPQAPLFLLKGTDCHLGAGTCLPQPLAPQRPGVHRATGHGLGPGQGRPRCQRPGLLHPLLHMQRLVWDPVYRHTLLSCDLLRQSPRWGGCPCSPL